MAVLSLLSIALAHFVFQQIKFTNFFMRSTISLPLAKAALQRVFFDRIADYTPEYDSPRELTQEQQVVFCENTSYKYYFIDRLTVDEEEMIIDESALININLASSARLEKLPGLDEVLAQAITTSSRRPFKWKEELLLIEGIDKETFDQFKDLITVHGAGKININTVSSAVLSVLGLDEKIIEKIIRYRNEYEGEDGKEDTDDDGAFTDSATIVSYLDSFIGLALSEQQALFDLAADTLSVKSEYLRFNIIPQVKGKDGVRYSILIHPKTKKIISWREQ
ncbi:MAG: helix-hairpin-helix domain-containing protein [Candidatus Omnitrophota bacterium]